MVPQKHGEMRIWRDGENYEEKRQTGWLTLFRYAGILLGLGLPPSGIGSSEQLRFPQGLEILGGPVNVRGNLVRCTLFPCTLYRVVRCGGS